jgi:hypothetical protein
MANQKPKPQQENNIEQKKVTTQDLIDEVRDLREQLSQKDEEIERLNNCVYELYETKRQKDAVIQVLGEYPEGGKCFCCSYDAGMSFGECDKSECINRRIKWAESRVESVCQNCHKKTFCTGEGKCKGYSETHERPEEGE